MRNGPTALRTLARHSDRRSNFRMPGLHSSAAHALTCQGLRSTRATEASRSDMCRFVEPVPAILLQAASFVHSTEQRPASLRPSSCIAMEAMLRRRLCSGEGAQPLSDSCEAGPVRRRPRRYQLRRQPLAPRTLLLAAKPSDGGSAAERRLCGESALTTRDEMFSGTPQHAHRNGRNWSRTR